MYKFGRKSRDALDTADNRLQRVFNRVIRILDCSVLCGHRNEEDQRLAHRRGVSQVRWPHSRHNKWPSLAVDVVPYPVVWPDLPDDELIPRAVAIQYAKDMGRFYRMAGAAQMAADVEGVELEWGGDFKTFFDGPHFQVKPDEPAQAE